MPELPEVETIKRGLSKFILKRKITKIDVLNAKSFLGAPVLGTVVGLRRFGKALILDLDTGDSLMIHLRMTGQLIFDPADSKKPLLSAGPVPVKDSELRGARFAAGHPSENFLAALPNKQTRVALVFDNGTLYFNDQRKFGFIKSLKTAAVEDDAFIKKLAPEPWAINPADFYEKLQKHKNSCIKAVILDQSIICGLGNIYADESLFMTKIHPKTKAGALSKTDAINLVAAAKDVMDRSIASGGSTMATYVKADGTRGDYLEKFAQVFRREGKPCPRCGAEIIKIRVAGRGTHLCPNCQKPKISRAAHD